MGNGTSQQEEDGESVKKNDKKCVNLKRSSRAASERRGLDGKIKGLKIRTGVLTCSWKEDCPTVSILNDTIRIADNENNVVQMQGDQEKVEIGGFQMKTRSIVEEDERKAYSLGINTKLLHLATFEVEVEKNGTITLRGRKLRESKEGQLKILTAPQVYSQHISIEAAENNRIVWIRIYYEIPPGWGETGPDKSNKGREDIVNDNKEDVNPGVTLHSPPSIA